VKPMLMTAISRAESPVHYWEFRVGDFVARKTARVTEVGFSLGDAEVVADLALAMAGGRAGSVLVLFYAWLEAAWAEWSRTGWTTLGSRVFTRRGLFGRTEARTWVCGFAHDREKLVGLVHWLWTLPGRDTLILLPEGGGDAATALALLEDDREDDGSNERRIVATFPTVLSRGERAESLRVLSKTWPEAEMRRLVVEASAGVGG
jgi:hypothetical protein